MFLFLVSVSSVLALTSYNWVTIWVSMELTSLFFVPLASLGLSSSTYFSMWVYFLSQMSGSVLFLAGCLSMTNISSVDFSSSTQALGSILLLSGLLVKVGFPPFHGWVVCVSGGLSWKVFTFMSTVVKVPVIVALLNLSIPGHLTPFFKGVAPMLMGVSLWGLFSSHIRHVLVFSSALNWGWALVGGLEGSHLMVGYLVFYFGAFVFLCGALGSSNSEQMMKLNSSLPLGVKAVALLAVMSMSGIPPSPGFFAKLFILKALIPEGLSSSVAMMVASVGFTYAYLSLFLALLISWGARPVADPFAGGPNSLKGLPMAGGLVLLSLTLSVLLWL